MHQSCLRLHGRKQLFSTYNEYVSDTVSNGMVQKIIIHQNEKLTIIGGRTRIGLK